MPHERYLIDGSAEEGDLLARLARITYMNNSECSYWIASDDKGESQGTYMVVCVLGPGAIADLQTALKVLMQKWEAEDVDSSD